jgi:hypothetical protein
MTRRLVDWGWYIAMTGHCIEQSGEADKAIAHETGNVFADPGDRIGGAALTGYTLEGVQRSG